MPRPWISPQNHGFFKGFGRVLASRRVPPFSWRLRSTKNQYFLIPEHQKSIFSIPGAPKINIFYPRSTKKSIFLSPEHPKSIFSIPGAQKINILRPRSTKNQYFLSPEHQKSIFSILEHQKSIFFVPGAPKINIFCPQSTKNQYFLSPVHHTSIFSLRIRLTNNQTPSAVAGTQLCCALDPPRQALCLRMAYRVRYPNQPAHIPLLLLMILPTPSWS